MEDDKHNVKLLVKQQQLKNIQAFGAACLAVE